MTALVGLITAAGESKRMGQPKVGLCFPNGTSFVSHISRAFSEAGCQDIYLSLPPNAIHQAFHQHLDPFQVQTFSNSLPHLEQSGSILDLLKRVRPEPEGVLVWPIDTPFAETKHLLQLITAFEERPESGLVVLGAPKRGGHPFLLGRSFFPKLENNARNGGLRSVVREHADQVTSCNATQENLFANLNCPDDYQEAFGAEPRFLPNSLYFMQ